MALGEGQHVPHTFHKLHKWHRDGHPRSCRGSKASLALEHLVRQPQGEQIDDICGHSSSQLAACWGAAAARLQAGAPVILMKKA